MLNKRKRAHQGRRITELTPTEKKVKRKLSESEKRDGNESAKRDDTNGILLPEGGRIWYSLKTIGI